MNNKDKSKFKIQHLSIFQSANYYILNIFFLIFYDKKLFVILLWTFLFIYSFKCGTPLLCDDGPGGSDVVQGCEGIPYEVVEPSKPVLTETVFPPMRETPDGAVAMDKRIQVYNNDTRKFEWGWKPKYPQPQMVHGPNPASIQDKLKLSMIDYLKRPNK